MDAEQASAVLIKSQIEAQADAWYPHFTAAERAAYVARQLYIAEVAS